MVRKFCDIISGGSRGGPPPAFWTKLRPEGPKKCLLKTGPLLSQGLDDSPPLPPNNSEGVDPSLIMQYMYVIRMSSICIVTAFLLVLISYMKRLHSICLVVLKGLGSFNGFFSFLCLVLGFLNVNLYSFFLLIKKMVLLMMLNIYLSPYLCIEDH